jgi:methylenetetrahydrofolate dehydrogenase (NADP+) / methenyltetrahydrofolate cyclohydrolase
VTRSLVGGPVADELDRSTRTALAALPGAPAAPCLASVHRGADDAFRRYLAGQRKAAERLGLRFREEVLRSDDGAEALADRVRQLDRAADVDGVLVEHPLPAPFDFETAIGHLRPEKDVDGVGPMNQGRLVAGAPGHVPAVCLAALAVAQHYELPIEGGSVAVVGRSATVGLPLALLLLRRAPGPNATVTVVHSKTPDLARALASARTIFSCAGSPHLLTRKIVPEGAAIVDVGLGWLADPTRPAGGRMVGDADPESLEGWASDLSPVPGGVGPVTVAELMANTVHASALLRASSGGP